MGLRDCCRTLKILIATGGSGGHLLPAQQLAHLLKEDCEVLFAGYHLSQNPFFEQGKIAFSEIEAAPLRKGFLRATWRGMWQSIRLLKKFRPDVVVGFGSFHTFPILLAAALFRKKLILFEANCVLGRVNRFFLPVAQKIALQFPQLISRRKAVLIPFLPWVRKKSTSLSREEARISFGLSPDRLTLLVFGGSQGASFFNERVPLACALLAKKGMDLQVLHMTGKKGEAHYSIPSCVKPFEKEMEMAYAAADLAICRSGAGTLGELIRFEVPSLLIPFPFASEDHQRKNGEFLASCVEGARLLLQEEATVERLAEEISLLWRDREKYAAALRREKMREDERVDFSSLVRTLGRL